MNQVKYPGIIRWIGVLDENKIADTDHNKNGGKSQENIWYRINIS